MSRVVETRLDVNARLILNLYPHGYSPEADVFVVPVQTWRRLLDRLSSDDVDELLPEQADAIHLERVQRWIASKKGAETDK